MSALVAVCDSARAHILTDATSMFPTRDTIVSAIGEKQTHLKNGTAVATIGFSGLGIRFSRLAQERATDFDAMVALAPEMFAEDRTNCVAPSKELPCAIVFAGWSEKRGRMKLHVVYSLKEGHAQFSENVQAWAGQPGQAGDASYALASDFMKRFNPKPAAFDVQRDGVALIEQMRRGFSPPSIGGFVRHTLVTRAGLQTEVVHCWPKDRVGHPIDVDDNCGVRPLPADAMEVLSRTDPKMAAKYEIPALGSANPLVPERRGLTVESRAGA